MSQANPNIDTDTETYSESPHSDIHSNTYDDYESSQNEDSNASSDSGIDVDEYNEFDFENDEIIRGKWIYDGSTSLDEMIERLKEQIKSLEHFKTDGWLLRRPAEDDYCFIYNPNLQH
jgi:hypothetical protein